MIVPYIDDKSKAEREIGYLEGKVTITFNAEFGITEEELLGFS